MLVINLFAGPGAGKSTTAAGVFAELKTRGYSAELVTEFAKECAWEGRSGPLRCQPYVFGEQLWRLERLRDRGVDVVVSDSPILLSAIYAPDDTPAAFHDVVFHYHERMQALDVFLRRVKAYDPRGRFQDLREAQALDERILRTLDLSPRPFLTLPGNRGAVAPIVDAAAMQIGPPG
jgi:hypothetical protein